MGQVFIGQLTTDDVVKEKIVLKKSVPGGGVAYSACAAAAWGGIAHMLSFVGTDYDLELLSHLKEKNVLNINNIKYCSSNGISLKIDYDNDNEHEFVLKKKSAKFEEFTPSIENLSCDLLDHTYFHLSPFSIIKQLDFVKVLKGNDKIVSLDPDLLELNSDSLLFWEKVLSEIDYFFVSKREFIQLLKIVGYEYEKNSILILLKTIKSRFSIKNIILKLGAEGVMAINDAQKIYYIPSLPTIVKDVTGAGDAFAGGFAYGITKGNDFGEALLYGAVASSIVIEDYSYKSLVFSDRKEFYERLKTMRRMINGKNLYINKTI